MTGFCICCLHCVCMCFHCTLFAFGVCATLVLCEMPAKLETTTQSKRRMQTQIPKYKELLKQSTIKHTKNTQKKTCNNNTQLLNKKHKHTNTHTHTRAHTQTMILHGCPAPARPRSSPARFRLAPHCARPRRVAPQPPCPEYKEKQAGSTKQAHHTHTHTHKQCKPMKQKKQNAKPETQKPMQ